MPSLCRVLVVACLAALLVACSPRPYDTRADARAELNRTLQQAKAQGKPVLVVFGANWCKHCVSLAKNMAKAPLSEHVAQRFLVAKVDVDDFNKNLDVDMQLGNPIKDGIPGIALLSSDGKLLQTRRAKELAKINSQGDSKLIETFDSMSGAARTAVQSAAASHLGHAAPSAQFTPTPQTTRAAYTGPSTQ